MTRGRTALISLDTQAQAWSKLNEEHTGKQRDMTATERRIERPSET